RGAHRVGGPRGHLRAVLRAARGDRSSSPPLHADQVLPEAVSGLLLPISARLFVLVGIFLGRDDGIRDRLAHASPARAPPRARPPSVPPASLSRAVLRAPVDQHQY